MENNLKTVILDFYGLPGAGKSTVSHLLAESLRKKGHEVYEPTYDLDHNKNSYLRKIYKLLSSGKYGVFHPIRLCLCIILVRRYGYRKIKDVISQTINIMIKYYVLNKTNRYDYIIFDEGLCQSAISLSILKLPEKANVIAKYLYKDLDVVFNIKPIYLVTDIEQALMQMDNRNGNDSRVEKIVDIKEKDRLMGRYLKACMNIEDDKIIVINTKEKSLEDIKYEIEKLLIG